MSKQPHPAEAQIQKALEIQAELISMLQESHEKFQASNRPWGDLASISQVNKVLAEALGFVHGCEGSTVLKGISE